MREARIGNAQVAVPVFVSTDERYAVQRRADVREDRCPPGRAEEQRDPRADGA